jgi:hypothetical protein
MMFSIVAVAGAYVAGTVSPAVGRKLKALFSEALAEAKAEVAKDTTAVKADAAVVEKKL